MAFMLHLTEYPSFVHLYTSSQQCYETPFIAKIHEELEDLIEERVLLFIYKKNDKIINHGLQTGFFLMTAPTRINNFNNTGSSFKSIPRIFPPSWLALI